MCQHLRSIFCPRSLLPLSKQLSTTGSQLRIGLSDSLQEVQRSNLFSVCGLSSHREPCRPPKSANDPTHFVNIWTGISWKIITHEMFMPKEGFIIDLHNRLSDTHKCLCDDNQSEHELIQSNSAHPVRMLLSIRSIQGENSNGSYLYRDH